MDMWPFDKLKELKKLKHRDEILSNLKDALDNNNIKNVYHNVEMLDYFKHKNDPLISLALESTIDTIARQDVDEAIKLTQWIIRPGIDKGLIDDLSRKALSLVKDVDMDDDMSVAGIASVTNAIAENVETGSGLEKEAVLQWEEAFERLQDLDVQKAFTAASNAAIPYKPESLLFDKALEKWEETVTELVDTDKEVAVAEIFRVAGGYANFGEGALPFRLKAAGLVEKLSLT
jgi:hypothetical protein